MGRGRTWSRWAWRCFAGCWRSRRAGRRQLQQILNVWFGGRRAHDAREMLYSKHFNNLCFCLKFRTRRPDKCAASILIQHVSARSHTAIDLTAGCGGRSPYRFPKLQTIQTDVFPKLRKPLHENYLAKWWSRMEKISWTDHVRNEEVSLRVNEQRNILHEIRKRKANWIGHILRRNCLLKQVTEWKIKGEMEVTRRRGRRRKKLLDDLKDRRGYSHLKEEALDRTMWRNRFSGGFGPVVRQNTEWWWIIFNSGSLCTFKK